MKCALRRHSLRNYALEAQSLHLLHDQCVIWTCNISVNYLLIHVVDFDCLFSRQQFELFFFRSDAEIESGRGVEVFD